MAGVLPTGLQQRPRFIKNTSSEVMPAFGAGVIPEATTIDSDLNPFIDGNEIVTQIRKPTADDVGIDPHLVIFNGPQAIGPGGTGVGTQDWPVRALHDPAEEFAGSWFRMGLREDSWYLWTTADGFVMQSPDPSDPLKDQNGRLRTIWVQPARNPTPMVSLVGYSDSSAAPAEDFQPTEFSDYFTSNDRAFPGLGANAIAPAAISGNTFTFFREGFWLVSFQAKATPTVKNDADEYKMIKLRLHVEGDATHYQGKRKNVIDDNEGYGTDGEALDENVAFSGMVYVNDLSKKYSIRNASTLSESVTIDGYLMAVRLFGPAAGNIRQEFTETS